MAISCVLRSSYLEDRWEYWVLSQGLDSQLPQYRALEIVRYRTRMLINTLAICRCNVRYETAYCYHMELRDLNLVSTIPDLIIGSIGTTERMKRILQLAPMAAFGLVGMRVVG